MQALAVGMEQPPEFLLTKHKHLLAPGNGTTLRLLYYPPLGASEPDVTRCGAHTDYGTFTLLAQVRLTTPIRKRFMGLVIFSFLSETIA